MKSNLKVNFPSFFLLYPCGDSSFSRYIHHQGEGDSWTMLNELMVKEKQKDGWMGFKGDA